MPLSNAQLQFLLKGDLSSVLDLVSGVASHNIMRGTQFANGTGAGQADLLWTDTRTLAASTAEDLDLVSSTLIGPFGAAMSFARVKGLLVAAAPGNTNNVIVGANVVNGWATLIGPTGVSGGTVTLRPGAVAAFVCGPADSTAWVTTAGTGDLLHVANSAGGSSVNYDVAIIGCST